MVNSINLEDLNEETKKELGLTTPTELGDLGDELTSLGKVFKALKGLSDDEALDILRQVQMYIISRKSAPVVEAISIPKNGNGQYAPPIEWVLQAVAKLYNLKPLDLKQRSREIKIVEARQVAMYALGMTSKYTFTYIGQAIGGRSPATATHAFSKIAYRITQDPEFKAKVEEVCRIVNGQNGGSNV